MCYNVNNESEVIEMKVSAKYKFVGLNNDGKTTNVNLPHASTTADTTKMETLLSAYSAAADFEEVIQIDHVKTEITSVTAS